MAVCFLSALFSIAKRQKEEQEKEEEGFFFNAFIWNRRMYASLWTIHGVAENKVHKNNE